MGFDIVSDYEISFKMLQSFMTFSLQEVIIG